MVRKEELNLAKRKNVADEITESLTKDILSSKWKDGKYYIKTSVVLRNRLKFIKDGTVRFYRHHDSYTEEWQYDDKMKTIKIGEMTFNIIWMMKEGFIELESIE